jgi:hypothetical protein
MSTSSESPRDIRERCEFSRRGIVFSSILSGICTAWGNGEEGRGRWPNVAFVGVGVVGDGTIPSCFWMSIVKSGEFTGRKVEAMVNEVVLPNV